MIASDPYLQRFVTEFTETNDGKAFFASLDKLGAFIFKDFESGKRKPCIDQQCRHMQHKCATQKTAKCLISSQVQKLL